MTQHAGTVGDWLGVDGGRVWLSIRLRRAFLFCWHHNACIQTFSVLLLACTQPLVCCSCGLAPTTLMHGFLADQQGVLHTCKRVQLLSQDMSICHLQVCCLVQKPP